MKMRTTTEKFLCLTCLVLCGMAEQSRAQDVACLGQIVPGERVLKIAAPPEAIIGELRVKRGMRVNAGDSLAILREHSLYAAKRSEAALHLETARIDLSLVKAGERREAIVAQEAVIAACRAEADLAKVRLNRYASLLKGGHVEQDRYDDFASQSVSLNARLRREESVLAGMRSGRAEEIAKAELAVKTADVALTAAQAALDLQTIHAPCAGEIVEISAWPGESVGDAGTLLSLAETDRMTVLAEVYEKDLARVKTGQRARVSGPGIPFECTGEVVEIQHAFEASRVFPMDPTGYVDRRIVVVHIRPENPAALAPYSQAHVTIKIEVP